MAAWPDIPWKTVPRPVFRLPQRMYRATPRGDVSTVRTRQHLPGKPWEARRCAVRRVPQDTRGQHTAGIDGVRALPPPRRWPLARALRLADDATPLRRPWIPNRGGPEQRALGRPTPHERARQTLVRQALAPAGEATPAPHTSGARPGRSGWEAIAAALPRSTLRPQSRLNGAIGRRVLTALIIRRSGRNSERHQACVGTCARGHGRGVWTMTRSLPRLRARPRVVGGHRCGR
jgi:RNA-directed DNA polymerase